MGYEEKRAEFEEALNRNMDSYFKARPQIERTIDKEKFIEAGFRMGFFEAEKRMIEANNANG